MSHLFIRSDSTAQIGTGHVMRCLALAQAWQDNGGKVTFISHCESDALRQRLIQEGMDFVAIEKSHPDPSDLDQTLKILSTINYQPSAHRWLVIDGYHFDAVYQQRIKDTGYKIIWIDDYGHAVHYYADIILNQNITADESLYSHRESYTRLLLGSPYVLLRREFQKWQGWQREIPDVARKVLVTLGGADPDNVTMKVIQAIKKMDIEELEAKIVVGPANPNLQILEHEISNYTNMQLIKNTLNMPDLMAWADIAVCAGGTTCWEMALMGLPNIIMIIAENQRPIAEKLDKEGTALSLGWCNKLSVDDIGQNIKSLLLSQEHRKEYSIKSRRMIDGAGSQRVCQELH